MLKKRQPILLSKEVENNWLMDDLNESQIREIINLPYDDDSLETFTVSKDLFNPTIDSNSMDITEPVNYPELDNSLLF